MFYRPAKLMICVAVNLKKNQMADNTQFDSDSISTTVFETDPTPETPHDQRIPSLRFAWSPLSGRQIRE
jgi:hypothetical protein